MHQEMKSSGDFTMVSCTGQVIQSEEEDETIYYDAVEASESGSLEFTVDVPIPAHRRTSSGISYDSQVN